MCCKKADLYPGDPDLRLTDTASVYGVYITMHSEITISQADHRPMYLQIMEQIRHRVAIGDWQAGQEIPSIRALAIALNISVITVKRAYLELEHEGVISTRQGRGSYISDNVDLRASLQQEELDTHLQAAIRTARLLGMNGEELEARLRQVQQKTKDKR